MTLTDLINQLPELDEDYYSINVRPTYTVMPIDDATKLTLHKLTHDGIYFRTVNPWDDIPPVSNEMYDTHCYFVDYCSSILRSPLVNKDPDKWEASVFFDKINPQDLGTIVIESHVTDYDMLWLWRKAYRFLEQNPNVNLRNVKMPIKNNGDAKKAHPADYLTYDFMTQSSAYVPEDRCPETSEDTPWTIPIYKPLDKRCYQLKALPNYVVLPSYCDEITQWLYQKGVYFVKINPDLSVPKTIHGTINKDVYLKHSMFTLLQEETLENQENFLNYNYKRNVIETHVPIECLRQMYRDCRMNRHIERFAKTDFMTWYEYNDVDEEVFLEDPFFVPSNRINYSIGVTELAHIADTLQ